MLTPLTTSLIECFRFVEFEKGFGSSALLRAYLENLNLNEVIGIESHNTGCKGGHPTIFVNLLAHIDWIENIVSPSEYATSTAFEITIEIINPHSHSNGIELLKVKSILLIIAFMSAVSLL